MEVKMKVKKRVIRKTQMITMNRMFSTNKMLLDLMFLIIKPSQVDQLHLDNLDNLD
jgi:hypothetical protein